MAEKDSSDKKETMKVIDRRSFAPDGSPREPDTSSAERDVVTSSKDKGKDKDKDKSTPPRREQGDGKVPPGDAAIGEGFTMRPGDGSDGPTSDGSASKHDDSAFVNLVVSIYQSGCIHLGLVHEEGTPPPPPDLDSARATVEMLMMLRSKTEGNLDKEEARILEGLLAELQIAFAVKAPGR